MTRRAAITGYPVAHSRSPLIHGYWLKRHGLDGTYERIAVEPETAKAFYRGFAGSGLIGCNVTVPHKEVAAACCDTLDDAAQAMGAANTLWLGDGGRLIGANTDGLGFLGNLDQHAPGWAGRCDTALVLGAGGAARAIVWALASRGVEKVLVANRTLSKAEDLANRFASVATAVSWDYLADILGRSDLVVNTTSLGMDGQPPLDLDLSPLPVDALVTDIVYAPLITPLLQAARDRGNPTVDGLGMLLHQAVPGFERWFGVRPEVDDALRDLILADLGVSS
ncbi:shikimate dehydrogenase [Stappia sp. ES.058]|uniref:shikimate dehydrogenase n=1 Tax=Stappia sp. ES.058 TaxID=1881061 RepID=UPI00087BB6C9|nr:shikimate dehydrogenase [Stappia sp. ES.058]SDU41945.1 shikimate dehydrogenase [Stappia sp. ES.058]